MIIFAKTSLHLPMFVLHLPIFSKRNLLAAPKQGNSYEKEHVDLTDQTNMLLCSKVIILFYQLP